MFRCLIALGFILTLVGCATTTNPLPADYAGPKAILSDSVANYDGAKADYFFLYKYNGRAIRQTYDVTDQRNQGNGFNLQPPEIIERAVPAQEGRYYLLGRTHYAAPIQDIVHGVYMVKGELTFTPKAQGKYVIRGTLGPELAEIWIEDESSGAIASNKLSTSKPKGLAAAHEIEVKIPSTQ
jgi:hypothetical protein